MQFYNDKTPMWFTLYYIAQKQLHSTNTEAVEEKKKSPGHFYMIFEKKIQTKD